MALVHLIPYWLVWAEIECMVQVALTKLPMNQFKLVHQKHITVAECPIMYIYCVFKVHFVCRLFVCGGSKIYFFSYTQKMKYSFWAAIKYYISTRFYNLESIGRNSKVFRTWAECRNSRYLFSLFILYDYEFEFV